MASSPEIPDEFAPISDPEIQHNSVINLPEDEGWQTLLGEKFVQYEEWEKRKTNDLRTKFPFSPPEQIDMIVQTQKRGYSKAVLERLLSDGRVNAADFSRELFAKQADSFNVEYFDHGCTVIDDYTKNIGVLQISIARVNNQNK